MRIQTADVGIKPDRVIHHVDPTSACYAFCGLFEVLLRVDHNMIRPGFASDFGLGPCRDSANHAARREFSRIWHSRMPQPPAAEWTRQRRTGGQWKRRGRKVVRGKTLEQHRGGVIEADCIRKRHDTFRRDERMRGIGAGRKDEGDAVAGLDVGYVVADGRNDAGAFKSKRQRQVALVEAAAQLSVEQIDARSLDLDQNLARARAQAAAVLRGASPRDRHTGGRGSPSQARFPALHYDRAHRMKSTASGVV